MDDREQKELHQKLHYFNLSAIKTADQVRLRLDEIRRLRAQKKMSIKKEQAKLKDVSPIGHAGAREVFKDMEKSL